MWTRQPATDHDDDDSRILREFQNNCNIECVYDDHNDDPDEFDKNTTYSKPEMAQNEAFECGTAKKDSNKHDNQTKQIEQEKWLLFRLQLLRLL